MSRIDLNIVATGNFSSVFSEIQKLRKQVADLNAQIARSGGISETQMATVRNAVAAYDSIVRSSGAFTRSMVDVQDQTARFGKSMQDGKLKVGEYFKTWREGAKSTSGQLRELALQQVALQQSILRTDPFKSGRVFVDTPRQIDEMANKTDIARKQMEMFNLSLYKGGDALINWGKNTQWAGRQMTVGLTIPIVMFGQKAADSFIKLDKELTRLTKVYGSGLNAATTSVLTNIRSQVLELSQQVAKQLGIPIEQTAAVAADLAATGMEGNKLLGATTETVRLATLGEIDRQEAVRATVSLQNVFRLSTQELTESINFLNAVENQTSTGLQDIVDAIPKASPVVAQLGGTFKDVAVMMVAMKEAGVPAAESANAIKSAVGSLINPTQKARDELSSLGIDLESIVTRNRDNLPKLFQEFQSELSKLSDLQRAQVIENIFGKYQFARISALLANIGQEGSQTQKVFELMGASSIQLAKLADSELKELTESVSGRYQRAIASFQAAIAPIGEKFVEFATKALNFFTSIADFVEKNPILKNILTWGAAFMAIVGPVVMLGGVLGNFIGYLVKGIAYLKNLKDGFKGFGEIATPETIAAAQAGELFERSLMSQAEASNILKLAIRDLNRELAQYQNVAGRGGGPFGGGGANPLYPSGYPRPPYSPKPTTVVTGPGGPTADVIPAMLSAGEAILNADVVRNLSPDIVRMINNDPKLAAIMNRMFGVYTQYNPETPVPYDPFKYNSPRYDKYGRLVKEATIAEGTGARQTGAGFSPLFTTRSGGAGVEVYHTTPMTTLLDLLGISGGRKSAQGRLAEAVTPPSGVISVKESIPSKIQRAAQDVPQHYYEPSEKDIEMLQKSGLLLSPDIIEKARTEQILSYAGDSDSKKQQIIKHMQELTQQDVKDWMGKGQFESKATAAVLQEHLHSILTNDGVDAAKEFEKVLQDAAKSGDPASVARIVDEKGLRDAVTGRVADLERTYQSTLVSEFERIPVEQRGDPKKVAAAISTAAKAVDDNLDRGYIDRVRDFTRHRVGGRGLFKVLSGLSKMDTDPEFSAATSKVNEDLKYSVRTLYKLEGDTAKSVDAAIDKYSNTIKQAAAETDTVKRDAMIKTATQQLKTDLDALGQVAKKEILEIDTIVRSATAQIAGAVPGTAVGQAYRTSAGIDVEQPTRTPRKRAGGGSVSGPGTSTSDSIPAMLSDGEYVINAGAVKKYGVGMMDSINSKRFAEGGMVEGYGMGGKVRKYGMGGQVLKFQTGGSVPDISSLYEQLADAKERAKTFEELSIQIEAAGTSTVESFAMFEDAMNKWSDSIQEVRDLEQQIGGVEMPKPESYPSPETAEQRSAGKSGGLNIGPIPKAGDTLDPEYIDRLDEINEQGKELRENFDDIGNSAGGMGGQIDKNSGKFEKFKNSMKAGSMASIGLAMGLGTAAAALGSVDNKAAQAVGGIAQFASMGMMFGPWGAAIGAAVGLVKTFHDQMQETARINENALASSLTISKEAAAKFGIQVRDLSNVQLTNLESKSKGAADSIKELAAAYSEAGDQVTKDFITKIREADPNEAIQLLLNTYRTNIIAGLSSPDSQIDVMALLTAAGRTDLTFDINTQINQMGLENAQQALNGQLDVIYAGMEQAVQERKESSKFFGIDLTPLGAIGASSLGESSAAGFAPVVEGVTELESRLDAMQPKINEFAITMLNAFQTMPLNDFSESLNNVFGEWNNFDAARAADAQSKMQGALAQREFNTTLDEMAKKSPLLAGELRKLSNQGIDYKDVLVAGQLASAGMVGSLDELRAAAANPIYAQFLIEKTTFETSIDNTRKEAVKLLGTQQPIKAPVQLEMVDDSAQQDAIRERYEGARKSAEKHYDRLDKAQEKVVDRNRKLIDNINEEREARQKVYDIQQKNLDSAVKTVNLQNEIAKAQAQGDLAKVAALKVELKGQQTKAAGEERERKLQAVEDLRIRKANLRIDAAERERRRIGELKDAALESIAAREKAELKALAAATKAENERRKATNKSAQAAYEAAQQARSSGRTATVVFDDIAKRLKTKLFANPELAMKDSVIRKLRNELIAAGYAPAKVDAALRKMIRTANAQGKKMMDGVGRKIYDELYEKGIKAGLSPGQASRAAYAAKEQLKAQLSNIPVNMQDAVLKLIGSAGIDVGTDGKITVNPITASQATMELVTQLQSGGVLTPAPGGGYQLSGGVADANTNVKVTPPPSGTEDGRRYNAWLSAREDANPNLAVTVSGQYDKADTVNSAGTSKSPTINPTISGSDTTWSRIDSLAKSGSSKRPNVNPQIISGTGAWNSIAQLNAAGRSKTPTVNPRVLVTEAEEEDLRRIVSAGRNATPTITPSVTPPRPIQIKADAIVRYTYFKQNGAWYYVDNQTGGPPRRAQVPPEGYPVKDGGLIRGPGTKTSDSIPARLSNGEYVIRAAAVDKYGSGFFDMLNNMSMSSKYNVAVSTPTVNTLSSPSPVAGSQGSMYNYNINVNVAGTNASADDIAQQVMNALKRRDNMIGTVTRI